MSHLSVPVSKETLVALDAAARSAGLSREGLAVQYITAGLEERPKPRKQRAGKAAKEEG